MSDEVRVVLVKPGDVLVLSNVGNLGPDIAERLAKGLHEAGIGPTLVFPDGIELGLLSAKQRARLAAEETRP